MSRCLSPTYNLSDTFIDAVLIQNYVKECTPFLIFSLTKGFIGSNNLS